MAATMITIAQVSDTHLGARTHLFRSNFDLIARALDAVRPVLVVASGDLTLDGADRDEDYTLAAAMFARLPAPVHAIPGNHDVGDHIAIMPQQPTTDERLARWSRHMGPDRWVVDEGNWRLIGLDTQIMGTHDEQAAQARMIDLALRDVGDRRIAVFMHKPAFVTSLDDPTFDYWSVSPLARDPLRALLAHPALRLVASGHLHLHRQTVAGRVRYAWAPAASFVVAPDEQPGLPGERPVGFLVHRLGEDEVTTELVSPPGLTRPFIHEIRDQTYPRAA